MSKPRWPHARFEFARPSLRRLVAAAELGTFAAFLGFPLLSALVALPAVLPVRRRRG
ncbi:hypothetical protein [Streptomyces hoynatensis]|uniref:hypothetical protein n=1 Tax=Streptomyces hoynatensis TaxID=1141874 RepID=UPI00131A4363|nr:hypothetical protein [Streptomyces hoynatensis]